LYVIRAVIFLDGVSTADTQGHWQCYSLIDQIGVNISVP